MITNRSNDLFEISAYLAVTNPVIIVIEVQTYPLHFGTRDF